MRRCGYADFVICFRCKNQTFRFYCGTRAGGCSSFDFAEPYRIKRLLAFLDPWASPKDEGYQLIQSLYALGSGGWFGIGLFNSRQKYSFLPFAESDFVFSVIGEETGVLGCLAVVVLFVVVIMQGTKIAVNSSDLFDTVLAGGITAVIGVQAAINFAVVTGLIPPTGLPLPFISFGGTSLVVFLAAVGLLQGIYRRNAERRLTEKVFCHILKCKSKRVYFYNQQTRG